MQDKRRCAIPRLRELAGAVHTHVCRAKPDHARAQEAVSSSPDTHKWEHPARFRRPLRLGEEGRSAACEVRGCLRRGPPEHRALPAFGHTHEEGGGAEAGGAVRWSRRESVGWGPRVRGGNPRRPHPPHALLLLRRTRAPSPGRCAALSDSSRVVLMRNRKGYASPRCLSVLGLRVSWIDQHSTAVGCSAPTLRSGSGAVSASASVSDPLLASASPHADEYLRRRHRRQSSGFCSRPRQRSHSSEELPHLSAQSHRRPLRPAPASNLPD